MIGDTTITRASADDLPLLKRIYAEAAEIQRRQNAPEWPPFGDEQLLAEIAEGRIHIVRDGATVAGIFTVAYDDPAIWDGDDREAYVYVHRVARAAANTRRGFMDVVLDWVRAHARELGRRGLRLDTWATNAALAAILVVIDA